MSEPLVAQWSALDEELAHKTQRALLFELRNTTYAIAVEFVSKVIEVNSVTKVPGSQPWLTGVVVHDFLPYPLIDPSHLMQSDEPASSMNDANIKKAVVIKSAHGNVLIGVEQLVTISELRAQSRVEVQRAEFPVQYIESVYRSDDTLIGVISIPRLLIAASQQEDTGTMGSGL